ncbi:hypothetical protein N0V88_006700 [Collariella sp. IMI 366227]|nr:hypothetical protein N0V88_006700 [Collariella sp. IMI 366227]
MAIQGRLLPALCAVLLFASRAHAAVQGVFAHYMVGGMSSIDQALADVTQAKSLGLDAFALNIQQPDADWTRSSLSFLFNAASTVGFKLFFSMDTATIPSPSACRALFSQYASHPAYYQFSSRPFLSTFRGGADKLFPHEWATFSPKPYFVPAFDDHPSLQGGVYPPTIFDAFPHLDGVMAWETAWPFPNNTNFGPSKHHPAWGNWFRPGGLNFAEGFLRALEVQPDFVELLTWNDAGEGHYFGNVWWEAMNGWEMRAVVEAWEDDGEAKGAMYVTNNIGDLGGICNYNYQVVEIV